MTTGSHYEHLNYSQMQ